MTRFQLLNALLHTLVFMMGAGIGSFLNVVVYRLPLGISVNNPKRSFCPSCKYQIPWYHNIPLFTWLFLGGKCANCKSPIAPRYFFVELLTAIIFYFIFRTFGGPWPFMSHWGPVVLVYWIFAALLIAGTFIDIDHFILPRPITHGGFFVGLIASFILPGLMEQNVWWRGGLFSLLSAGLGFGLLWLIVELGKLAFGRIKRDYPQPEAWTITQEKEDDPPLFKIRDLEMTWDDIFGRATDRLIMECGALTINSRTLGACRLEVRVEHLDVIIPEGTRETVALETVKKLQGTATKVVVPREAMGKGDVYLLAMIGAFLGWKAVIFTIMASSFLGSILGAAPRLIGKTQWTAKIPYGPYLAAGAMLWLFYGHDIVTWYLGLVYRTPANQMIE